MTGCKLGKNHDTIWLQEGINAGGDMMNQFLNTNNNNIGTNNNHVNFDALLCQNLQKMGTSEFDSGALKTHLDKCIRN